MGGEVLDHADVGDARRERPLPAGGDLVDLAQQPLLDPLAHRDAARGCSARRGPTHPTRPAASKAAPTRSPASTVWAIGFSTSVRDAGRGQGERDVLVVDGRHGDHGRVDAGADERVDVGQDREVAGDAVRVAAGIGDGDEVDAGRRPEHAGVVASHHAEPDETGAQRRSHRHHAPAFATVLTAATMRSRSRLVERGVHRQRDAPRRRPARSRAGRARGVLLQRRQPVVRDRVVDAVPTWYSSRSAADEAVAVLGDADRVLVVDVRRRRRRPAARRRPRGARRGTRRCAAAVAVQAPTLVSCTRPIAAWMSVIRLLKPMTSFSYWRSMPWLRSSRTRRASLVVGARDHAALAGGHVLGRVEREHRERAEACRPGAPSSVAPCAWAASSKSSRPCRSAIAPSAVMSAGWP